MAPPGPLLILLLLPGCFCSAISSVPPPPPPSRPGLSPLTVATGGGGATCPGGLLGVAPGPTSVTAEPGATVRLPCDFDSSRGGHVTWYRVAPQRGNGSQAREEEVVVASGEGRGGATLTFPQVAHNHSGLYFCRVEAPQGSGQSCGTFLRVREPVAPRFLDLKEATKNRLIVAQGVLLLVCAVGPGLLLLFRKRWANERLLQMKKALEEENLYEGLNLDECSMYEDISRGLHPTYQDVGGPPPADPQLEKP